MRTGWSKTRRSLATSLQREQVRLYVYVQQFELYQQYDKWLYFLEKNSKLRLCLRTNFFEAVFSVNRKHLYKSGVESD